MRFDRIDGALCQQRAEPERHIRTVPHLLHCRCQRSRHTLPAILGTERQTAPSGLGKLLIGLTPAGHCGDTVRRPLRTLLIAGIVQWPKYLGGKLAGLVENGGDYIGCRLFVAGQLPDLLHAAQVIEHKQHIFHRRLIAHANLRDDLVIVKNQRRRPAPPPCPDALLRVRHAAGDQPSPSALSSSGTASNKSATRP